MTATINGARVGVRVDFRGDGEGDDANGVDGHDGHESSDDEDDGTMTITHLPTTYENADVPYKDGLWDDEPPAPYDIETNVWKREGQFDVLCGNYGGKWSKDNIGPKLTEHVNYDMKSAPAQILIMQEAEAELLEQLKTKCEEGEKSVVDKPATRGGGVDWIKRPTFEYLGVRGRESGVSQTSLLVVVRATLAKSVRVIVFQRLVSGHGADLKPARSRIMVVGIQMKIGGLEPEPPREMMYLWWRTCI